MRRIVRVVILAGTLFVSCGPEKEDGNGNDGVINTNIMKSDITSPTSGNVFKLGEKVEFKLTIKEYSKKTDSVLVYFDDVLIYTSVEKNKEHTFSISTDTLTVGLHQFRSMYMFENSSMETAMVDFMIVPEKPVTIAYTVSKSYPHDPNSYTQGLEFHNGNLYEGTGREGQSLLRLVNLLDGKPIKEARLGDEFFGEGITIMNGKVYQLTWSTQKGFVYDLNSFKVINEFTYKTQGWGLTHDEKYLIMSDGSEKLRFLNPETFVVEKTIQVCDDRGVVNSLNELEYINGEIWANVYLTDRIVRINPKNGAVTGSMDLTNLHAQSSTGDADHVLNGIAYDAATKKLFLTGKLWNKIYEVVPMDVSTPVP